MNYNIKHDQNKLRWGLVPFKCLDMIAEVFTYGANKYTENGWKQVEAPRYKDALLRHISAWMQGEKEDKESGLHHLAHAATNIIFLLWMENEKN